MNRTLERQLLARCQLDLLVGLSAIEFGLGFAALFDRLGQANFIVLGQKGVLAYVREVEAYEVLIVTINAIRSLLLAGSAKKGLRCSVEIVEDSR